MITSSQYYMTTSNQSAFTLIRKTPAGALCHHVTGTFIVAAA